MIRPVQLNFDDHFAQEYAWTSPLLGLRRCIF